VFDDLFAKNGMHARRRKWQSLSRVDVSISSWVDVDS
jgi:hypothetical protein